MGRGWEGGRTARGTFFVLLSHNGLAGGFVAEGCDTGLE